jgi:HPr kinase/phosphorylase
MYSVDKFYKKYSEILNLQPIVGQGDMQRPIKMAEPHRPGLSLSGYVKNYKGKRILVFGKVEIEYLRDLDPSLRTARLKAILNSATPLVIVARRYRPPKELLDVCKQFDIPLFRTPMTTVDLLNKLTMLLTEDFAPTMHCHGTLVEVFGVGVLIKGDSAVGKSEAALGLIERGHRLISDDVVIIRKREESYLEGYGVELTQHHMEIRGIGIINIGHLYGAICVRDNKSIDLVVQLEVWNEKSFYDRVGLDEKTCDLLGVRVPFHVLPVKPGRDVVLLLETIALNHRLKGMGYHSAKEFNARLLKTIADKQKKRTIPRRQKDNILAETPGNYL